MARERERACPPAACEGTEEFHGVLETGEKWLWGLERNGSGDWARHWRQHGPIVISGFQSETENEALQVLLGGVQPIVLVLARGMLKRLRPEYRQPLDEGRLLLVSPFPDTAQWVSAENAQVRNRIVCALTDEVLIAHAEADSKTAKLAEAVTGWGKPVWTVEHPANRNLLGMGFQPYSAP